MGECLLEKTAMNDDEESGRVLLMLGKLQIEIQKLIDNYRSHIFQTITKPAESLLNELRVVEDMKRQCDVKRKLYEDMVTKHIEKGRSRSRKGESVSSQQLQAAHDNYDEDATLFVFRLKSLKQGQSRSLLTQAARHHAAQLCFFRKALSSLERVEPDLKSVTEHHHIDYQFSGLEDDDMDSVDNDKSESSSYGDGELSFDYGRDDQGRNAVSTPRESMEIVNAPRAAVGSPTDKFEVFYIDYGNQEEVSYNQIRPVDPSVSSAPGLAQLCNLAHIKVPTLEEDYGHEAAFRLSELILNGPNNFRAIIEEKDTSICSNNFQITELKPKSPVTVKQEKLNSK